MGLASNLQQFHHPRHFQIQQRRRSIFSHSPNSLSLLPSKCTPSLSGPNSLTLDVTIMKFGSFRNVVVKCKPEDYETASIVVPGEVQKKEGFSDILSKANTFLPHVVLASTLLALAYPPSFTWFTNRQL